METADVTEDVNNASADAQPEVEEEAKAGEESQPDT